MSRKVEKKPQGNGPMGGPRPGHGVGMKGEKPKNFWPTTKRLFRYMSKRLVAISLVFILAIAAVIFQIRTPRILGEATTEIFKGVMKGVEQMKLGEQLTAFPIDFDKIAQILMIVADVYSFSNLQLRSTIYYDPCITKNGL